MLAGYLIDFGWVESVPNPLAVRGIPFLDSDAAFTFGWLCYALALALSFFVLALRFVRGSAVVRAQVRWLAAAIGVSMILIGALFLTENNSALSETVWTLWMLSLLLPPVAIGIAILRYHLYDIDRIVSNAIGYSIVTVILFATFAAVNLTFVAFLTPLVKGEGIAVAASTLVVAALFQPLRVRVQRRVDRRFHRARDHADRTAAEFSERLRDEVDIAAVTRDLRDTVAASIKPARIDLWLRNAGRGAP